MTSEPATGLVIGALVAERFEVEEEHDGGAPSRAFLGVDRRSGRKVILIEVSAGHAAALKALIGLEHRHLARVLAVVELDHAQVLVAEHVAGLTLEQRLSLVQKKTPVDAVRVALRLADTLAVIHEHGGVHGLVSALSLIVAPEQGPRPILGFAPGSAAALRAPGGAIDDPSPADDSWAAAALLHWMLTGHPPAEAGFADQAAVVAAGVDDQSLAAALLHMLAADGAQRSDDLKPLRRELARWFVDHAGEEPPSGSLSLHPSGAPPPLPGQRPSAAARAPAEKPVSSHLAAFALVAIGLGLIGGWVFSALRPAPAQVVSLEHSPAPAPSVPAAAPIELGEIPVTGQGDRVSSDKLTACVADYLPAQSFAKVPDVSWLCGEQNPRTGAEKLRIAVVASAPRAGPSSAMKIFARIGWYDMAAFAVVRAGCCADAPALSLENLAPNCPKMDAALREIADAVIASKPAEAALKKYTDSIHCELNAGHGALLGRAQRPVGGEDSAFLELVKKLDAP